MFFAQLSYFGLRLAFGVLLPDSEVREGHRVLMFFSFECLCPTLGERIAVPRKTGSVDTGAGVQLYPRLSQLGNSAFCSKLDHVLTPMGGLLISDTG